MILLYSLRTKNDTKTIPISQGQNISSFQGYQSQQVTGVGVNDVIEQEVGGSQPPQATVLSIVGAHQPVVLHPKNRAPQRRNAQSVLMSRTNESARHSANRSRRIDHPSNRNGISGSPSCRAPFQGSPLQFKATLTPGVRLN